MRANDMRILERRLKELTTDVLNIEAEMERDPKLRRAYAGKLKDIQHRRRGVQERLAELRLQQALAWEKNDFAVGLDRVLDRLGRGLDRLTTRRH